MKHTNQLCRCAFCVEDAAQIQKSRRIVIGTTLCQWNPNSQNWSRVGCNNADPLAPPGARAEKPERSKVSSSQCPAVVGSQEPVSSSQPGGGISPILKRRERLGRWGTAVSGLLRGLWWLGAATGLAACGSGEQGGKTLATTGSLAGRTELHRTVLLHRNDTRILVTQACCTKTNRLRVGKVCLGVWA